MFATGTNRLTILSLMLFAMVGLGLGQNQAILTIDESLDDDIDRMEVRIEFGLGVIKVERGNPSKSVTGFIQYNDEIIVPTVEYWIDGRTAKFRLETDTRSDGWGFSRLRNFDDYESPESELYFSTRIPIDFDFSCGLGEAEIDFGDLRISNASIDNGLGETILDFSTPNPIKMRRLSVENGLGELKATNLANANAPYLHFDCGLGDADLDFGGELEHDMEVVANIGLGSMTFRVPESYNLELDAEDNFLSSIDADGMVLVRRGLYRSYDFDSSSPTIYIKASIGLGSIDIIWTD